jgi:alpha-D-ribose 1-methylphosphonate 5-triphosphate synthase subunit PhnG
MQTPRAPALTARILTPLASERDARRDSRASRAAATKVDFFTLMRGDD